MNALLRQLLQLAHLLDAVSALVCRVQKYQRVHRHRLSRDGNVRVNSDKNT